MILYLENDHHNTVIDNYIILIIFPLSIMVHRYIKVESLSSVSHLLERIGALPQQERSADTIHCHLADVCNFHGHTRDSNLGPPDYESDVITFRPPTPVELTKGITHNS